MTEGTDAWGAPDEGPDQDGSDERLLHRVRSWRDSVAAVAERDRLLRFRHRPAETAPSFELTVPSAGRLLAGLGEGLTFTVADEADGGAAAGHVSGSPSAAAQVVTGRVVAGRVVAGNKPTRESLERSLRRAARTASRTFAAYGEWVLRVGAGFVEWRDGDETGAAPLLLVPVELLPVPGAGTFEMRPAAGHDITLNPALAGLMDRSGIDRKPVERLFSGGPADAAADHADPCALPGVLEDLLAAVRGSIGEREGWAVTPRVVLGLLSTHRETAYRDLLDHDDHLVTAAPVLAGARELPLAAQDFPPGTDAAELAGRLLEEGRTVLVAGDSPAELDAVVGRLRETGAGPRVLPLYGRHATRAEVAGALGAALRRPALPDRASTGTAGPNGVGTDAATGATASTDATDATGATSDSADVAPGSGVVPEIPAAERLLLDALDRLARLGDVPALAEPEFAPETGDEPPAVVVADEDLPRVLDAAARIARAWRPVAEGDRFVWGVLRDDARHPRAVAEALRTSSNLLTRRLAAWPALTEGMTLGDAVALAALLDPAAAPSRDVPEQWLTCADAEADVRAPVTELLDRVEALARAAERARAIAGTDVERVPGDLSPDVPEAEARLADLSPAAAPLHRLTAYQAELLAERMEAAASELLAHRGTLASVAEEFGVPAPEDVAAARDLAELTRLTGSSAPPLPEWLAPEGADRARARAEELRAALAELRAAARALTATGEEPAAPGEPRVPGPADTTRAAGTPGPAPIPAGTCDALAAAALEAGELAAVPDAEATLPELDPPGLDVASLTPADAGRLATTFTEAADTITTHLDALARIAPLYGYPAPADLDSAFELAEFAELGACDERPEPSWLDLDGLARAVKALATAEKARAELDAARTAAAAYFHAGVTDAEDLAGTAARLRSARGGLLSALSGRHRRDRRRIEALLVSGTWSRDVVDRLPAALAWQDAHRHWVEVTASCAPIMGRYWRDGVLDAAGARLALDRAARALELAPHLLSSPAGRAILADRVSADAVPEPEVLRTAREAQEALAAWSAGLLPAPAVAGPPALRGLPLARAAAWMRAHVDPLRAAERLGTAATAPSPGSGGAAAATGTGRTAGTAGTAESPGPDGAGGAAGSPGAATVGELREHLDSRCAVARRWLRAREAFARAVEDAADVLGDRLAGTDTDVDALLSSIAVAERAWQLAPVAETGRLARQLCAGGTVDARAVVEVRDAVAALESWHARVGVDGAPYTVPEGLIRRPWPDAAAWLRAHVEPLREAAATVRAVEAALERADSAGALTVRQAREALAAVAELRALEHDLAAHEARDRALLGDLYAGAATVPGTVRTAVERAFEVRAARPGGPGAYSPAAVAELRAAAPDAEFGRRVDQWLGDLAAFLALVRPEAADRLRADLVAEPKIVRETLDAFAADADGPRVWAEYRRALGELAGYGLADLPARAVRAQVPAEAFAAAVERELLGGRIRTLLESEEPPHGPSGTGVVLREAAKAAGHLPVRDLLGHARHLLPRRLPCVVTDPLTAGRVLPPDVRFDVLILGEDPGTAPGAALTCLYRAKTVVVAPTARGAAEQARAEQARAEQARLEKAPLAEAAPVAQVTTDELGTEELGTEEVLTEGPVAEAAAAEEAAAEEAAAQVTPVAPAAASGSAEAWAFGEPYVMARPRVGGRSAERDMHDPAARAALRRLLVRILEVEAPMSCELLYQRAREAWRLPRLARRSRDAMDDVLGELAADGTAVRADAFVALAGRVPVPRRPGDGVRRTVREVPPQERRVVLRALVEAQPGMSSDALIGETSRFFAWARRGPVITGALSADIREMLDAGELTGDPDSLLP